MRLTDKNVVFRAMIAALVLTAVAWSIISILNRATETVPTDRARDHGDLREENSVVREYEPPPNQPVSTVPFRNETSKLTRMICIQVKDYGESKPIGDAALRAFYSPTSRDGSLIGKSDQHGELTFDHDLLKDDWIVATAPGFTAKMIRVSENLKDGKILIRLGKSGAILGRVMHASGTPLWGISLSVSTAILTQRDLRDVPPDSPVRRPAAADEGRIATTRTDEHGRFEVTGLPVGPVRIRLDDPSYVVDNKEALSHFSAEEPAPITIFVSPLYFAAIRFENCPDGMQVNVNFGGDLKLERFHEGVMIAGQRSLGGKAFHLIRQRIARLHPALTSDRQNRMKIAVFAALPGHHALTDQVPYTAQIDPRAPAVTGTARLYPVDTKSGDQVVPALVDVSALLDRFAPVTFRFVKEDGSPSKPPPCQLREVGRPFGDSMLMRPDVREYTELETRIYPGEYDLEPAQLGAWTEALSFRSRRVRISDVTPQVITVALDDVCAVLDLEVHDEYGRPIDQFLVGLKGGKYVGGDGRFVVTTEGGAVEFAVTPVGTRSPATQVFQRNLALGSVNKFTVKLTLRSEQR